MAGLSPTSFNLFPTSFHLSPRLGACPAGLSPTSFHLSPTSFHLSPSSFQGGFLWCWLVSHFLSFVSHFFSGWVLVVGFPAGLSPKQFTVRGSQFALKNGRLGAGWSGRVPSRLVSHFLCLPVLFSRGSRLACLPLPFICLPILFICPQTVYC